MRIKIVLLLAVFLTILSAKSQVTVSGATGANGTYANLRLAFNAINAWTNQSGNNIVITISSSITDNFTATLNQSSSGVWSSLIIYPTTSGLSLTGTVDGPLIDLNGADYVTIDGRVNAAGTNKDLVITNLSTSTADGTSTIRLINNAVNNTLQYCTIKGSELSTGSGIIFFSGSGTNAGNNDNSINNCNITSSASGRPVNAIYSYGVVLGYNSRNSVTNNLFYDFFNPGISSNGISLNFWNDSWTITDNSFYETSAFSTTADVNFNIIYVFPEVPKLLVSNNYFGGNAPYCNGSWTKTGANNGFNAIYLLASTISGNESSIQNNTIKNITWSNSAASQFNCICVMSGNVNIGNVAGNTIGDPASTGSIVLTNGATGGQFTGIYVNSTVTVTIQNNILAGITTANSATTPGTTNLTGIYLLGNGARTVSNNTIGSLSIPNSILASSVSTGASSGQSVFGIFKSGTGTFTCSNNLISHFYNSSTYNSTSDRIHGIRIESGNSNVSGNIVKDLSISCGTGTSQDASAIGIMINANSYTHNVLQNTVYNIKNTHTGSSNTIVYGLYFSCNTSSIVEQNFIHSLENSSISTDAVIAGMMTLGYGCIYRTNIISLTYASSGAQLIGFNNYSPTGTLYIYFNTISLSGTPVSGTTTDAAFVTNRTNPKNIRNNIFSNTRGGAGIHRAVQISSTSGLTIGYNCYIGALSGITLNTAPDNNSNTTSPAFVNEGGSFATDYKPTATTLYGISISGITSDFAGTVRRSIPTMGAFESDDLYFFVDIYKGGILQESFPSLYHAFQSINNGVHTGSLEIRINDNSNELNSAILNASGTGSANYTDILIYPTVSGLSISGNLITPLIDLNGADYVTIDGRVNATGDTPDLVLSNSNTSNTVVTSTLRFRNSAQNNCVRYCIVKGSGRYTLSGVIFLSGALNSNNLIHNCNMTSDAAGRPVNMIYSVGSAVGSENSNMIITNNKIYDFFNPAVSSYGFNLGSYNKNWTISDNHFYETTAFNPSAGVSYIFIAVNNSVNCSNIVISGNKIGGSAPDAGGVFSKTASNNPLTVFRLSVASGPGLESSIQNNSIKNFSWANTSTGTFTAIQISSGDVNIEGNTIGDTESSGSIYYAAGSTGGNFNGMYISSGGNVNIRNNTISGITTDNSTGVPAGINFNAIFKDGNGPSEISNNMIGSTSVVRSIHANSTATQYVRGIINTGTGSLNIHDNIICNMNNACTNISGTGFISGISLLAGSSTISDNRISDLTIAGGSGTLNNASASGIVINTSGYDHTVSQNTCFNMINTYSGNELTHVYGLFFNGSGGSNLIEQNFIYGLENNSSNSSSRIAGIYAYDGTTRYQNNIISLNSSTYGSVIQGLYNSGGIADFYFNTVSLSGAPALGNTNDAAFCSDAGNVRNIRNNIFSNTREGSAIHFAVDISSTTDLTIGYNNYFGTLSGISLNTPPDHNSFDINPIFENPGGFSAPDYYPSVILTGLEGLGINGDFFDEIRAIPPSMGALELLFNSWTGDVSTEWDNVGNWSRSYIPTVGTCVKIPDVSSGSNLFPYIECLAECKIAWIAPDAKMEIAPDHSLTVHGSLYNDAGTSGLIIHSDDTGTGSLIFSNTEVNGTFERYFSGTQWHYIASPIRDASISLFNTNNFYRWDASMEWGGVPDYFPWIPHYSDLMEAQGYAYYYYQSTLEYQGTFNQGSFPVTLYKSPTGNEDYQGWNLIGNPYTSAIDWEALVNDASAFDINDIEGAVYFFDDDSQTGLQANYRYYVPAIPNNTGGLYGIGTGDATAYIPAGQGFFVKAVSDGATMVFDNSYRVHHTQDFYKSKDLPDVIRLSVSNELYHDELVIRDIENAGVGFDALFDARKLFPNNSEFPMLYAINNEHNEKMAINSISVGKGLYPLGLKCSSGDYVISVVSSSFTDIPIYLYDDYLKTHIDLNSQTPYHFSSESGLHEDRFFLRFNHNSVPFVSRPIDDVQVFVNTPVSIEIGADHFYDDDDNDRLTIEIFNADSEAIPEWLSFSSGHLYGIPSFDDIGVYEMKAVVTDLWGAVVEEYFNISVHESALNLTDNPIKQVNILPNPGSGLVRLIVDSENNYTYDIIDKTGRILYQGYSVMKESTLDFRAMSNGVYFIKVNIGQGQIITKKLMIQ